MSMIYRSRSHVAKRFVLSMFNGQTFLWVVFVAFLVSIVTPVSGETYNDDLYKEEYDKGVIIYFDTNKTTGISLFSLFLESHQVKKKNFFLIACLNQNPHKLQ